MRSVTKEIMLSYYEKAELTQIINVNDRIIARRLRDDNKGEEIVYCLI